MDTSNKTAVITGGASGIGAALAAAILRRGGRVVIVDIDGDAAKAKADELGDGVTVAAQAGVAGHLQLGDGAVVAAQSGVARSLEPGAQVMGSPAVPLKEHYRTHALLRRLRDLFSRVQTLEKGSE